MKTAKLFIYLLSISFFLFVTANNVSASEALFEMDSLTQYNYRCFAASIQAKDGSYKISISCRNLIYPLEGGEIYSYVIWGTPKKGGKTLKFGSLGLGKVQFSTKKAFTSLFVTLEKSSKTKEPTGITVMRGDAQKIEFLEKAPTPTPTPTEKEKEGEETKEEEPEKQEGGEEEDFSQMSIKDKLLLAFKRAGVAALLAIVALLGLIYIITKSKG